MWLGEFCDAQGSYRQVLIKFKDFSGTSQDSPSVFKDKSL